MDNLISDASHGAKKAKIKCLIWDLDNTLWNGTLLAGDQVTLRQDVVNIIETLESRGIMQSIASRNDFNSAMDKLKDFKLDDYFIYPQINWNTKASSIKKIQEMINIGLNSIAFIDDQVAEREEVKFSYPEVLTIDAQDLNQLLDMPEFTPDLITNDSKQRRLMYLSDIERKKREEEFVGPKEDFLASLDMVFTISEASKEDLKRAEELTVRTNQLNTTGKLYSYDDLNYFLQSPDHKLLISSLWDKFGTYGKIGLALIETHYSVWTIELLLMSCRVISRGVGTIMINHIRREAKRHDVRLRSEMICNEHNRMMYMTYKFTDFHEKKRNCNHIIFENDLSKIPDHPEYIKVIVL